MTESLYYPIAWIFLIEFCVLLVFLIVIPFHRLFLYYRSKKETESKKKISHLMVIALEKGGAIDQKSLRQFAGTSILLSTLETFEKRFISDVWSQLKGQISASYLLPYARRKVKSSSWIERNFAARCFALTPLLEDQKRIQTLSRDSVFLVRSFAAIAICHMEDKKGILELIIQMSREKGYAYYFYRDLFLQSSGKVFDWIREIAETEKNPAIHLVCLDLLSEKSLTRIPAYLSDDLKSENPAMRLAAVKILARNPHKSSLDPLMQCLEDHNPNIRVEAVSGLKYFAVPQVLNKLKVMLQDPEWLVRLRAAQTLKKMGQQGMVVLTNQQASDAAQTVLEYGWEG